MLEQLKKKRILIYIKMINKKLIKKSKNKLKKYRVNQYNHIKNDWDEIGKYRNFKEIGKKLKLSAHIIQNIKLGRHKKYKTVFQIILLKKALNPLKKNNI